MDGVQILVNKEGPLEAFASDVLQPALGPDFKPAQFDFGISFSSRDWFVTVEENIYENVDGVPFEAYRFVVDVTPLGRSWNELLSFGHKLHGRLSQQGRLGALLVENLSKVLEGSRTTVSNDTRSVAGGS